MKGINRICSILVASAMLATSLARADVCTTAQDEPLKVFLKVSKVSEDSVRFELCKIGKTNVCVPVGRKSSYTLEELSRQRKWEFAKMAGLGVADVGIAIGATVGFLVGGGALSEYALDMGFPNISYAAAFGGLSSPGSGPLATAGAVYLINDLNPARFYRRAQTLNPDRIESPDFCALTHEKIFDYKHRLESVLDKIDSDSPGINTLYIKRNFFDPGFKPGVIQSAGANSATAQSAR